MLRLAASPCALAPLPLPLHVLPDLVELKGSAEPISDLGPGHRHIYSTGPRWTYRCSPNGTDCRPDPDPRPRPVLPLDLT